MALRRILTPLAALYRVGSLIDRAQRSHAAHRSPLPVISVGNIASGGTGKTQCVLRIVEELQQSQSVIVLSRGYGRASTDSVVWRAGDALPAPAILGDEPSLIASTMRNGAIGVGVDRVALLRQLEYTMPGAAVVLDDGFQHHQIRRDCDIVLVDRATVEGALIPVGELREPFRALRRADILIVSTPDLLPFTERWRGRMTQVFVQRQPSARFLDVDRFPVDLVGRPIVLVTGIAQPERVLATAERMGAIVVGRLRFRDHARYDVHDADRIIDSVRAHRAVCALTTSKDAVKLARFDRLRDQLALIDVRIELEEEHRFWAAVRSFLNPKTSANLACL